MTVNFIVPLLIGVVNSVWFGPRTPCWIYYCCLSNMSLERETEQQLVTVLFWPASTKLITIPDFLYFVSDDWFPYVSPENQVIFPDILLPSLPPAHIYNSLFVFFFSYHRGHREVASWSSFLFKLRLSFPPSETRFSLFLWSAINQP